MVKTSDENDGKNDVDLDRSDGNVKSGEVGERGACHRFSYFFAHLAPRFQVPGQTRFRIEIFSLCIFVPATCDRLITNIVPCRT